MAKEKIESTAKEKIESTAEEKIESTAEEKIESTAEEKIESTAEENKENKDEVKLENKKIGTTYISSNKKLRSRLNSGWEVVETLDANNTLIRYKGK